MGSGHSHRQLASTLFSGIHCIWSAHLVQFGAHCHPWQFCSSELPPFSHRLQSIFPSQTCKYQCTLWLYRLRFQALCRMNSFRKNHNVCMRGFKSERIDCALHMLESRRLAIPPAKVIQRGRHLKRGFSDNSYCRG